MARGPFDSAGRFGSGVSESTPGINIGAPAASTAGALGAAAKGFARQVQRMADRALTREGERDAAEVIEASNQIGATPGIRQGQGVDDQAYNAVVRQNLLARRQAIAIEETDKAEIANPDNLAEWEQADSAVWAAFTPTGDPELDTSFDRFRTVQRAQAAGRVRQRQETARKETVRGAFVETATVGRTALGQAIASAGFDDAGSRLVGASLRELADNLASYGPKEGFSLGGQEYGANPNRAGVVDPGTLAEVFGAAEREARMNWIASAAERAPDAMAQRAFLGQVQERWAAGDAAFMGLDAGDFSLLSNRLEQTASRTEADEAARVRAAEERVKSLLEAGEYGDDVDLGELRELAAATGDPALMARVDFAASHGFEVTPASLRAEIAAQGQVGDGFAGWSNFLLDQLEGPGLVGNDNGRGRAQWGVTEASHPEAWRDGRVDRAEAQRIYRQYWQAVGGDTLDPELAFVAANTAVIAGAGVAREMIAQAGGSADRFLDLADARYRRLAQQNPGKYGDDLEGWLNRSGKERGWLSARRAQRRSAEGYVSDPIGFARGNGRRQPLASVAELDPAQLMGGDDGPALAFLSSRWSTGQTLAQRDGVPPRVFASEEVTIIKNQIAADPGALVTLARRAGQALGGEGARSVLRELDRGGVSGADLQLASLAMDRTKDNIVALAIQGRAFRMENGTPPKFESGEAIDDVLREVAPAFAAQPELAAAVRGLATDMAYGDVARGDQKAAAAYVNSALGATTQNGHRFGGVATINGARTVAPDWLRADMLDDTVEVAARMFERNGIGPVYSNGNPIPARVLQRYQLRAMPDGRYQMIDPATGRPSVGRDGRAFHFDIEQDAFRQYLGRQLPAAILRPR